MKQGQTYHEFNCPCDFCKAGDTRHPDRAVTSEVINSTEFPRDKRLDELEEKLSGEYVGGMTEFWQRQKDFLLSKKGQDIADVLDGPEQECYPSCQKGMTKDTCPHNPKLGCDCGANSPTKG